MIYVVMAALFESLILPTSVITSLLFSFTGVFWAFMVTGTSMSIMGMIGMLILMGIVVNNGIVLVDRINQLINEGLSLYDAVIEGCMTRIRPILMTVATTVSRAYSTCDGEYSNLVATVLPTHQWPLQLLVG